MRAWRVPRSYSPEVVVADALVISWPSTVPRAFFGLANSLSMLAISFSELDIIFIKTLPIDKYVPRNRESNVGLSICWRYCKSHATTEIFKGLFLQGFSGRKFIHQKSLTPLHGCYMLQDKVIAGCKFCLLHLSILYHFSNLKKTSLWHSLSSFSDHSRALWGEPPM